MKSKCLFLLCLLVISSATYADGWGNFGKKLGANLINKTIQKEQNKKQNSSSANSSKLQKEQDKRQDSSNVNSSILNKSSAELQSNKNNTNSDVKFKGFGGYNLGDRFSGKNKVEESSWAYSAPWSTASSLEKLRPKTYSSYYLILEDMKLDKGLASFKKEIKIVATAITNKIVGLQMSYDTGWKGNFLDEYNKIIFALNKKFEVTGQTHKNAVRNRKLMLFFDEYWCKWELPGNIIAELFSNGHNLILKIYLEDYDLKLKNESEKYKKVSEIEKNKNLRKQSETIDMSGFD